jgi:nucleoid-associated protein YgaU
MALSVKVALMTCLGFIFGMSWLVSLVARPMVDMPTPLVVRGLGGGAGGSAALVAETEKRSARPAAPVVVTGRFARSSPLEIDAQTGEPNSDSVVLVEASYPDSDLEIVSLPPLYVPQAPVIARADEPADAPTALAGAGSSVMTITSIPEAIIADAPARGARMLATLVSATEPTESVAQRQADANAGAAARAAREYEVKQGDTLVKIMRREWNSDDAELMNVLLAANPDVARRRNLIYPGEVLSIPVLQWPQHAQAVERTGAGAGSGGRGSLSGSDGEAGVRWYTIRERDSLASIARRLLNDEGRWREIARLNEMPNAHRILPGTRIKLPPPVSKDT